SPQRSMVTSLLVTLAGGTDSTSGSSTSGDGTVGAFGLADGNGRPLNGIQLNIVPVGGNVVKLTFSGPGTEFGSLKDGSYTWLYDGTPVKVPGFFRLFGDSNGDGRVDATDRYAFMAAYRSRSGQANYVPFFDFNQNGMIDASDFYQFLRRYGSSRSELP